MIILYITISVLGTLPEFREKKSKYNYNQSLNCTETSSNCLIDFVVRYFAYKRRY